MTLKKLPLGVQSFEEIIDGNFLYADKTRYTYELLDSGADSVFLSRPRGFGKTLLLSSINELFTGNRERFKDLWIGQSDYDFQKRPVIFLSFATNSKNTEEFELEILEKLSNIAKAANLEIDGDTPIWRFIHLIRALNKKAKTKVVVLIDDCDDPVARNLDKPEVAKDNSEVLLDFLGSLKDPLVKPYLHFTFITGVTKYALACGDSGPNHFNDISLDPRARYTAICGFSMEEFDRLFSDRMESTLLALKEANLTPPETTEGDLKRQIINWYGGYNWVDDRDKEGDASILNPYSILNFFENRSFSDYWTKSGRPAYLTSLMEKSPLDFLDLKLKSYERGDLSNPYFDCLSVAPFLFNNGYLTMDKRIQPEDDSLNNRTRSLPAYSLRFPNYEVSSWYKKDCLKVIYGFSSDEDLKAKAEALKTAILKRDAEAVGVIFVGLFRVIASRQRLNDEYEFREFIQITLSTLGFKLLSEIPGDVRRPVLLLDLSGVSRQGVYCVIELKHLDAVKELTMKENNQIFNALAKSRLTKEETDIGLISAFVDKHDIFVSYYLSLQIDQNLSIEEYNDLLAKVVINDFTAQEIDNALEDALRDKFSEREIDDVLREAANTSEYSPKGKVDVVLSKAVKEALYQIEKKDYHGPLKKGLKAKEIIDLGLAIYGAGTYAMEAFRPKPVASSKKGQLS
jgi:hypothetical protein